jgi:hypothetical protein
VNPFLQILGIDPGIKAPSGPKAGNNITSVFGELTDTESNIGFGNLLDNIDILKTTSEQDIPLLSNIEDNLNTELLPDNKSTFQILSGLGTNEIPINTGNPEKIEMILSSADNINKPLENKIFQSVEIPRPVSAKTNSFQQPQLNPEIELQKPLTENRPIVTGAIPTKLTELQI